MLELFCSSALSRVFGDSCETLFQDTRNSQLRSRERTEEDVDVVLKTLQSEDIQGKLHEWVRVADLGFRFFSYVEIENERLKYKVEFKKRKKKEKKKEK